MNMEKSEHVYIKHQRHLDRWYIGPPDFKDASFELDSNKAVKIRAANFTIFE